LKGGNLKCLICGKRIWFWQKKDFTKILHKDCLFQTAVMLKKLADSLRASEKEDIQIKIEELIKNNKPGKPKGE
jgi:hypothetical protein